MAQHIFSGSGAPATTPTGIGHHYIDTLNNVAYISVGTTSAADWDLSDAGAVAADLATHIADTANPHSVTKTQVGLGNVDNTSDINKPVSTAQGIAIGLKKTDSMDTNKLLGRGTAGTGVIEEITLGTGLVLAGTTLNASGVPAWGAITGVITDQTDLANELTNLVDGDGAYYFTNTPSDLGAGRLEMTKDISAGGGASESFTGVSNGDYLSSFCTVSGFPNVDHLPAGPLSFNCFAIQTGGTQTCKLYAEFYVREVGGTQYLIGTTPVSEALTGVSTNVKAHTTMQPYRTMGLTDRLLIRFRAEVTGVGTAPDVTLNFQGTNVSRCKFPSETYVALNSILPSQSGNAGKILGTDGTNASWVVDGGTPTGTADTFAGYDGSGDLNPIPGWGQTTLDGMSVLHTYAPAGGSGSENDHVLVLNVEPTANSPNRSVNLLSLQANLDNASSGFSFGGPTDSSVRILPMYVSHQGTGNVGDISFINTNFNVGNGTDPISVNGISYAYGFGTVNANVTLTNQIQGYGFQPNVNASATMNNSATAFYDNANIGCPVPGYTSVGISPQIAEIENNNNYLGINIGTSISAFEGNAGATGIGVFGTYASPTSWQGIVINPTVSGSTANYAVGLNVTMDNVTVFAGVAGSVTVQDLTYTWNTPGEDANNYSVEYVGGGTAGSESVSLLGNIITVQIEDTVSTANQIKAAIEAVPQINAALTVTVSGTGTNTQTIDSPDAFTGGQWAGNKYAAQFDGNVSIDGGLSFTGALSVGEIQAFYSEPLTDGGGVPGIGHSLITAPTVAANATIANADYLAVNTASLINIGANATVTTAFLGVSAMGLPAVLTMGASSTLDRVSGAVFALSLDPGGSTGTVDQVSLCRALAIPNGVTVVNRFYGYEVSLPFGAVGTDAWGIYVTPDIDNWLKGSLRIGGTTISDDQTAAGNKLHVDGNSFLDGALESTGNIGFFGTTPVAQQTSSGAQTATGTWTATEQAMLQEAYDALRAYGLLS